MPIRSELPGRAAALLRGLLLTAALGAAAAPALVSVHAQPAPPAPPAPTPAQPAENAELAAELSERYRLLPSRDGVLLVPHEEVPGIQTIEVAGGEVIVNGEPVAETILRSWFGAEAEPLLALAALEPAAARALVPSVAAGAAAEEAAEAAERAAAEAEEAAGALPEAPEAPGALEVPGPPRENIGAKFAVGESVEVRSDEVASEVVVMGGGAHVAGEVYGDLVVIGGSARVEGKVGGEVVAVGGSVELGPQSHVEGEVTSVGGGVRRAEGARVDGAIQQVSSAPWTWRDRDEPWRPGSPFRAWRVQEAVWHLLWVVTLALLVLLTLLVARRTTEGAAARVGSDFGDLLVSALVGILGVVLFVFFVLPALGLVFVLLVVTIVGCLVVPLVAVAVPVIVVAVLLVGYAAAALRLGRALSGRLGRVPPGVYAPAIVGVVAVQVWALAGDALQVLGGPAGTIGLVFVIFGYTLEALVWLIGLGALLRHLFGGGGRPAATSGTYAPLPPGTPSAAMPPAPPAGPPSATPATPPPATTTTDSVAPPADGEVVAPERPVEEPPVSEPAAEPPERSGDKPPS